MLYALTLLTAGALIGALIVFAIGIVRDLRSRPDPERYNHDLGGYPDPMPLGWTRRLR